MKPFKLTPVESNNLRTLGDDRYVPSPRVNRQQRFFFCRTIAPPLLCAALTMFSAQIANGAQKEDARAAIQVQRKALTDAVTRGDASGVARVFATDGKFMLAGFETIAGREAIQKFWQVGLSNGLIKGLILTPVDIEGEGGELLVETGTLTTLGKGGEEQDRSKYVIVWKREQGEWRIYRDIANSDSAPAPKADRVGFPADYRTKFKVLGVPARDTNPAWVLTAYGNENASAVTNVAQLPYQNGSIIVMEFTKALKDSEGKPSLDSRGQPQKGDVDHVDVMRREKDFGEAYGKNRSGEWEFAGYHLDGSYSTPPARSASCAECHLKAGAAKDFVFPLKFRDIAEK